MNKIRSGEMLIRLASVCGLGIALCVGVAHASTVQFVGTDVGDNSWRTPAVPKPLDPDGNNVYGSAGYVLAGSQDGSVIVNPPGVTVTQLTNSTFNGNTGYTEIDNPTSSGTIRSGVWYNSGTVLDQVEDFAELSFGLTESYVVGIYTDNQDYADISPIDLRIEQVSGPGSGDSGYIANTPSRGGEWYFFDVSGVAGDDFLITGISGGSQETGGSSGIGLITFDAGTDPVAVPEPGTVALTVLGLGLLGWRNRRNRPAV
jgi:hypothetical protein